MPTFFFVSSNEKKNVSQVMLAMQNIIQISCYTFVFWNFFDDKY